ncbi:MAG: hypothetical protein HFH49_05540 [Lachnospiraceae bacterium]|nr:hypothetical protein [Lachnospiraceae bacterium]
MEDKKSKMHEAVGEKEWNEAERLAEKNHGKNTYTHVFKEPFVYEDRTFEALTFDWGRLTGRDGLAIERELQTLGIALMVPAFSGEYLIRMAAKASVEGISSDMIEALPLQDYNRIRSAGRSFLLKAES